MEDLTGKRLGLYVVVAPLGEGGMAAVYKAYQPAVDRYVALKILPRQYAADPDFVSRFSREARLIAKLEHPNILPVFDFGKADDYTYIAMRYVETGTLADLLAEKPLPLEHICGIITQVGGALDYAHAQGVLHRDIKPSNILIDSGGHCLLTDFGLAKMVEGTVQLTTTGAILGTPAYMSPEQGLGLPADSRSDIYTLGVVLYEMATGHLPFRAETPVAIVIKHINAPLPLPRIQNPSLPESVERVILKSLAKEPGHRYATAGGMVRALQSAIPGSTSYEAPLPMVAREPRVQPRWTGPGTPKGPQAEQQEVIEKTSVQLNQYWNLLKLKSEARISLGSSIFFGLLSVVWVVFLVLVRVGLVGHASGEEDWAPVIFILSIPLFLAGYSLVRSWSRLGRAKGHEKHLEEMVKKEGNFYICPCGMPRKRYSWGQLFKLKKCRKCGRPYLPAPAPS